MKKFAFLMVALLSATSAFAADSANTFGKKGSTVLQITYGTTVAGSEDGVQATPNSLTAPSFDYFIFDNVSVGGQFTYGYNNVFKSEVKDQEAKSNHTLSVGPRVGYAYRICDMVSVWPRVGLNYGFNKFGNKTGSVATHGLELAVEAPVTLHVHKNVFLSTGPALNVDLVNKSVASSKGDVTASATTQANKSVSFGWNAAVGFNF
jgi:hypothetical protein